MFWLGQIVIWVGITLFITIFVLLRRRQLYKQFPLFTLYVAYMSVTTLLCALTLSRHHLYYLVYWATEPGGFVLELLAVYESFMKVFRGFYLLQKFRLLLPGAIVLALVISVFRTISHPGETATADSIINSGAMAAQYIVLAISMLFVGLVILLHVPWRVLEYRIMLGFGISALGDFSDNALYLSKFRTEFAILSSLLAGMAYILALVVWVTALRHPSTPKPQVINEGVSSESLVRELRRQVAYTRSMLRR
jgi:hypothetical protein